MKLRSGSSKQTMALFGALACLAGGCATADYGVPVDAANRPQAAKAAPALWVSAAEAVNYSTRYLGLVEVTFENRTPVWKQVDRVGLDFGNPAKDRSVTIASTEDIDAWVQAIRIRPFSPAIVTGTAIDGLGLRVLGDVLGTSVGQCRPVAAGVRTGTASATPGAPADAASATPGAPAGAAPSPPYPDQHLLTTPFRIPPGLSTKRWILLSTPDNPPGGCIESMILSYETSDHATGRVRLPFKDPVSEWQPACGGTTGLTGSSGPAM
jgi:hypothetical protein